MRTGVLLFGLLAGAAHAHDIRAVVTDAPIHFSDRVLVNADGEPVRFRGDVAGAGPAIISFTYTDCLEQCPVSEIVMRALEAEVDGREDPQLVTITLAPDTDTPERLARYARETGSANREWLTGDPQSVAQVLDGLGMPRVDPEHHPVFFVVVNGAGDRAARVSGADATPEFLLERLNAVR